MQAETAPPENRPRGLLGRFKALRERVAALSRSPHAHAAMLGVSVVDGSVFPIPPFAILVPMVLAEPKKWARYATTGTVASLVGGLIGYALGFLAVGIAVTAGPTGHLGSGLIGATLGFLALRFTPGVKGRWPRILGGALGFALGYFALIGLAELSTRLAAPIVFAPLGIDTTVQSALTDNFWMLALLCSILPTPYKVVAIGSGFVGVGLPEFMIASMIGRTARFFGVSGAFALFGESARRWIKV